MASRLPVLADYQWKPRLLTTAPPTQARVENDVKRSASRIFQCNIRDLRSPWFHVLPPERSDVQDSMRERRARIPLLGDLTMGPVDSDSPGRRKQGVTARIENMLVTTLLDDPPSTRAEPAPYPAHPLPRHRGERPAPARAR